MTSGTLPPPEEPRRTPPVVGLDRLHCRCLTCGQVWSIKDIVFDFGFDSHGIWIGLGYCKLDGLPGKKGN